jgi:hypothetical protein
MKIIKIQLELLRLILHFLLNFKKPTDKLVVVCSEQLDKFIIRYHKANAILQYERKIINKSRSIYLIVLFSIYLHKWG